MLDTLVNQLCTSSVDGQVKRAAARFCLCLTAGLLAVKFDVLPLTAEDIAKGINKCFEAWLAERGTTGALENAQIVERTKQFLELHGPSRFVDLDSPEVAIGKTTNRAGFKQTKDGKTVYYILTNVFKIELCQGIPADRACKALVNAGLLIRQSNDRYTTKLPKEVADVGRANVYAISIYDN